jgi:UDP-glucose 4-epimerase
VSLRAGGRAGTEEDAAMATCLVTGGAGFIGSHLVKELARTGWTVRVLDDFSTGKEDNLAPLSERVHIHKGSITDPVALQSAVSGASHVFHLAAVASVQRSLEDPLASHSVCATGTLQVLNAARLARVRRVVYAASSSAYGSLEVGSRTENDPVSPLSPYAAAKLAGEHYCSAFWASYGLETVRLRFFNIFGPRQDAKSPYSGVIALFIAAMSAGKAPTVHGDGLQTRDFNYVANAVDALVRAAQTPDAGGKVYNIGNGVSTTILDLVAQLNLLLGASIAPRFGPTRQGDVRHSLADISRAQTELGYEPSVSFLEGLRLTLKEHRAG